MSSSNPGESKAIPHEASLSSSQFFVMDTFTDPALELGFKVGGEVLALANVRYLERNDDPAVSPRSVLEPMADNVVEKKSLLLPLFAANRIIECMQSSQSDMDGEKTREGSLPAILREATLQSAPHEGLAESNTAQKSTQELSSKQPSTE